MPAAARALTACLSGDCPAPWESHAGWYFTSQAFPLNLRKTHPDVCMGNAVCSRCLGAKCHSGQHCGFVLILQVRKLRLRKAMGTQFLSGSQDLNLVCLACPRASGWEDSIGCPVGKVCP